MKYKKTNVNIYGDKWIVHLSNQEEYVNAFGKSSCALTTYSHDKGERYFFFSEADTTKNTVVHEVMHAYFSYQCIDSVGKLSLDKMEEVFCEFVANNLQRIIKTSNQVYRFINR